MGYAFLSYGIITNYIIKYLCPSSKDSILFIIDVPIIALTAILICCVLLFGIKDVYIKRRHFFHGIEEEIKKIQEGKQG